MDKIDATIQDHFEIELCGSYFKVHALSDGAHVFFSCGYGRSVIKSAMQTLDINDVSQTVIDLYQIIYTEYKYFLTTHAMYQKWFEIADPKKRLTTYATNT